MKRARLGISDSAAVGQQQQQLQQGVQLRRVRAYLRNGDLDELEFRRQLVQSKLTSQRQMFVCTACLQPFMYSSSRPSKTTARKHCRVFHQDLLQRIETEDSGLVRDSALDAIIAFRMNPLLTCTTDPLSDLDRGDKLSDDDHGQLLQAAPRLESLLRDIHSMVSGLCSMFGLLPKNLERGAANGGSGGRPAGNGTVDPERDAQLVKYLVTLSNLTG